MSFSFLSEYTKFIWFIRLELLIRVWFSSIELYLSKPKAIKKPLIESDFDLIHQPKQGLFDFFSLAFSALL